MGKGWTLIYRPTRIPWEGETPRSSLQELGETRRLTGPLGVRGFGGLSKSPSTGAPTTSRSPLPGSGRTSGETRPSALPRPWPDRPTRETGRVTTGPADVHGRIPVTGPHPGTPVSTLPEVDRGPWARYGGTPPGRTTRGRVQTGSPYGPWNGPRPGPVCLIVHTPDDVVGRVFWGEGGKSLRLVREGPEGPGGDPGGTCTTPGQ